MFGSQIKTWKFACKNRNSHLQHDYSMSMSLDLHQYEEVYHTILTKVLKASSGSEDIRNLEVSKC
jgi:hypothetical protein